MGVTPKIAPSMLSSDFANLASEAHRMLNCGADWLHMDIMVLPPSPYHSSSTYSPPFFHFPPPNLGIHNYVFVFNNYVIY